MLCCVVCCAEYQPVAHHSSLLYFCVTDLAALDTMYAFSLRWFNNLFVRAIADSPQSSDVPTRLQLLNDYFTFFLFKNVCRCVPCRQRRPEASVLCARLCCLGIIHRLLLPAKPLCLPGA